MSILPPGSLLSISTTSPDNTYSLAVDTVVIYRYFEYFRRDENTGAAQRRAKEIDGSGAIFDETAKNKPFQIFTGCGPETARRTVPDDDYLTAIHNRFDTTVFEIKGAESLPADLVAIQAIANAHQAKYAKFESYKQYISSEISIDLLTELQDEDFAYLTTTNVHLAGPAILKVGGAKYDNCLIAKFDMEPTIEFANDASATTSTVYLTWSAKIEIKSLTALEHTTWTGV